MMDFRNGDVEHVGCYRVRGLNPGKPTEEIEVHVPCCFIDDARSLVERGGVASIAHFQRELPHGYVLCKVLLKILSSEGVVSSEAVNRRYEHEVLVPVRGRVAFWNKVRVKFQGRAGRRVGVYSI